MEKARKGIPPEKRYPRCWWLLFVVIVILILVMQLTEHCLELLQHGQSQVRGVLQQANALVAQAKTYYLILIGSFREALLSEELVVTTLQV